MPLTADQKATAVNYLKALPAWTGGEATLNALSDAQLVTVYNDQVRIQELDAVFNSVKEYLGDDALTVNGVGAALEKKKCGCGDATHNALHDQAALDAELAKLPPALRVVVTNAVKLTDEAKAAAVEKLVANCADEAAKTAAKAVLNKLQPADLEALTPLVAAPVANKAAYPPVLIPSRLQPLYIGGAGGGNPAPTPSAAAPTTNKAGGVTPLGLPSLPDDYWTKSN